MDTRPPLPRAAEAARMPPIPFPVRVVVALPMLALLAFPALLVAVMAAWSSDRPVVCAFLVIVEAALVGLAGGVLAWAMGGLRGHRLVTGAVLGAGSVLAYASWLFLTQP